MKYLITTIALFLATTLCAVLAPAGQKKVLVINSYHAEYPWVVAHNNALIQQLSPKAELTFYYLDSKRLSPDKRNLRVARAMKTYEKTHPDVVVLTDDFALKELGKRIMNQGTPVVFLGINNNPRHYLASMPLATGVLEKPLLKRSLVYIKDILGDDFKKALVLFDSDETAYATVDTVFKGQHSMHFAQTATQIKLNHTFRQWKQNVLNAKKEGYDVIILGLYHTLVDDEGNHIPAEQIAEWTSAHSPVPTFGFWDFSVGKGKAVGGLVLAGKPQGEEAAKLVQHILAGISPHTIQPVIAESGRFIFSRSELKRWNITLPKYFDTPTEPIEYVE